MSCSGHETTRLHWTCGELHLTTKLCCLFRFLLLQCLIPIKFFLCNLACLLSKISNRRDHVHGKGNYDPLARIMNRSHETLRKKKISTHGTCKKLLMIHNDFDLMHEKYDRPPSRDSALETNDFAYLFKSLIGIFRDRLKHDQRSIYGF